MGSQATSFFQCDYPGGIPLGSKIVGGLLLLYVKGLLTHPAVQICLIFQQEAIGNHALIGTKAVVLVDVPDNCMTVGIPTLVKSRQRQDD